MSLTFIGKDEKSGNTGSPTVWVDLEVKDFVFQGIKADEATETEALATGNIPDHETIVRIPFRMIKAIREACDAAERAGLL